MSKHYGIKLLVVLLTATLLFSFVPATALAETAPVNARNITSIFGSPSGGVIYRFDGTFPAPYTNFVATRSLYKTMGDEVAYCIDFLVPIRENASTRDAADDFAALSATQKEQLLYAITFGYNGSGPVSDVAYFATQVVVWNIRHGFFEGGTHDALEADTVDVFFANLPAGKTIYNQIVADIKDAQKIPSFADTNSDPSATTSLAYNVSTGLYEATLTDTNNVLQYFNITQTNGFTVTKPTSNTLKITSATERTAVIQLTRQISSSKVVYWVDNSGDDLQALITAAPASGSVNKLAYVKARSQVAHAYVLKTTEADPNLPAGTPDVTLDGFKFRVTGANLPTAIELTTDATGRTPTIELPPGTYTFTEYDKKHEKYVAETAKTVTIAAGETKEVGFHNRLAEGQFEFTKLTQKTPDNKVDLVPLEGAIFFIYNAKGDKVGECTSDASGHVLSPMLKYGEYTVKEQPHPTHPELVLIEFTVKITVDKQIINLYFKNDAVYENGLKLYKVDQDSGKKIAYAGAKFKIKDAAGNFVTMIVYPSGAVIDTFETAADGTITIPKQLPYGKYYLIETEAPAGYVLDATPLEFTVSAANEDPDSPYVKVEKTNQQVKGKIQVAKTGEQLATVTEITTPYGTQYRPVYQQLPLAGVVFEIYADGDIITRDGTKHYSNGDLVDTITTGADGKAESILLPLGTYIVKEKSTVSGYVLNVNPRSVELKYKDQNTAIVYEVVNETNNKQKLDVQYVKDMDLGTGKTVKPFGDIVFGAFADQEFTAADGKKIPKDGLVALSTPDATGHGTLNENFPFGKFYAKELKTATGYILNTTIYAFEFIYGGPTISTMQIKLNNGNPISNKIIQGKGYVLKVDTSSKFLPGAVFKLYTESGVFVAELTTGADGKTNTVDITYGKYYWVETKAPAGCKLDTSKHYFDVVTNGQVIEIKVVNHYDVVKTGDTNNIALWAIVSIASLGAVFGGFAYTRKKRKDAK